MTLPGRIILSLWFALALQTSLRAQQPPEPDERFAPPEIVDWGGNIISVAEQTASDRQSIAQDHAERTISLRQAALFHEKFHDRCIELLPDEVDFYYEGPLRKTRHRSGQRVHGPPSGIVEWDVVNGVILFSIWLSPVRTPQTAVTCQIDGDELFVNVDFIDEGRPRDEKLPELGGRSVMEALAPLDDQNFKARARYVATLAQLDRFGDEHIFPDGYEIDDAVLPLSDEYLAVAIWSSIGDQFLLSIVHAPSSRVVAEHELGGGDLHVDHVRVLRSEQGGGYIIWLQSGRLQFILLDDSGRISQRFHIPRPKFLYALAELSLDELVLLAYDSHDHQVTLTRLRTDVEDNFAAEQSTPLVVAKAHIGNARTFEVTVRGQQVLGAWMEWPLTAKGELNHYTNEVRVALVDLSIDRPKVHPSRVAGYLSDHGCFGTPEGKLRLSLLTDERPARSRIQWIPSTERTRPFDQQWTWDK